VRSVFKISAKTPCCLGRSPAALLVREEDEDRSIILSETLKTISSNLNKERRSREWLNDAQSYARAGLRGITRVASMGIGPENDYLARFVLITRVYFRNSPGASYFFVLESLGGGAKASANACAFGVPTPVTLSQPTVVCRLVGFVHAVT
jgi:hypothetical protein